ncbi:MAG: glucose PTS transporter subunit EIIB, partial [Anaerobacillus sp.]
NWWMNLVLGAAFFFIYYFTFSFAIKKWDLATPGRGGQENKLFTRKDYNKKKPGKGKNKELALDIMEALGGERNLKHVDACFTRLRVEVADVKAIDENRLKELGAAGVVKVDQNIQAIFGGRSDLYKNEINKIMKESDAS